jgi:CspA family cold shock protein
MTKSFGFHHFELYLSRLKINKMQSGKVKFFNESKGFGFIKDNDSEKEYFVHVTGLIDKVRENDDVTFDVTEGRKGLNAVNVKLA